MTKPRKSVKRLLWDYTEAIVTALILALLIRAYVVQAFKIPSGSMKPTLLVGDHILVGKFIYGTRLPFMQERILVLREPQRGDVIVFRYPKDPSRDFVKRIIAVGGDVVQGKDGVVYLNGRALQEPYVNKDPTAAPAPLDDGDFGPILVPQGKVFVMGDNRGQSYDSRYWGFVDIDDIKGKAFIIYWSWDRQRHLPRFNRIGKLVH
jgi:signal peptidase I